MTRFSLTVLACCLLSTAACGKGQATTRPSATANDEGIDPEQAKADYLAFEARFFDEWFAMSPVTATVLGIHSGDDRWPQLDAEGRAKSAAWVDEMLAVAKALQADALDADSRVDLRILQDQLALMQIESQHERSWETNPLSWVYLMGAGMDSLVYRDFAPLDARMASLVSRLEGLPTVVAQAKEALADAKAIKAPHAKVAAGQVEGLLSFIDSEIPKQSKAASEEARARLGAARKTARAALVDFRDSILSPERLEAAAGEWRLGAEVFGRKLPHTLGMDLSAEEVYARATKTHAEVRTRMEELAFELYEPLFGKRPPGAADELGRAAIVKQVLEALATVHPTPEGLREACENNLATIGAFVDEKTLVPQDPKEILEVIWTPPHQQGVAIAGLDPAPPFDDSEGLQSFYIVQPIPKDWSAGVRESFLREYNHFMLEILSIHEAIPGHFVQLYYGKRDASRVRKAFYNGPFVEGWAVYTEKLMVDAGYPGVAPAGERPDGVSERVWTVATDPALRQKAIALHGAKFFLRAVTNTIIDHDIHAGTMTEAEAIELMTQRAYQQEGEARGKWVRAQVTNTQLSTYFAGASAWFELRAQADAAGQTSDLAAWHAEALNHGAPPVGALPELMSLSGQ